MRMMKPAAAAFFAFILLAAAGILALRLSAPAIILTRQRGQSAIDARMPVELACAGRINRICGVEVYADQGPVDVRIDVFERKFVIKSGLAFGARYMIVVRTRAFFVHRTPAKFSLATARPARLDRVIVGGLEARRVLLVTSKPEIVLAFSSPMNRRKTRVALLDESTSQPVALYMRWDPSGVRAVASLTWELDFGRSYAVVLADGSEDENGLAVEAPEHWTFQVLGVRAAFLEERTVIVDRKNQRVLLCGPGQTILEDYPCATGVYYPTPGTFRVFGKIPAAKSLFDDSRFSHFVVFQRSESGQNVGFHSIPVFPDGRTAGGLGKPDSHGCVRLSAEAAKFLYDWAQSGTLVIVH